MLISCVASPTLSYCFFFNEPSTTEIYTLSLHDALPIYAPAQQLRRLGSEHHQGRPRRDRERRAERSEEHTSELQSRVDLVCRLLLEKKKKTPGTELPVDQDHHGSGDRGSR